MDPHQARRALACLQDYDFLAWSRKRGRRVSLPRPSRDESRPAREVGWQDLNIGGTADRVVTRWIAGKMAEWARAGRLDESGRLRVQSETTRRAWRREHIRAAFPELRSEFDVLALLIDLDGEIEVGYMDQHENIRNALISIMDHRLSQHLGGTLTYLREQGAAQVANPPDVPQPPVLPPYPGVKSPAATDGERTPSGRRKKRVRDPKTGELVTREELERLLTQRAAEDGIKAAKDAEGGA